MRRWIIFNLAPTSANRWQTGSHNFGKHVIRFEAGSRMAVGDAPERSWMALTIANNTLLTELCVV